MGHSEGRDIVRYRLHRGGASDLWFVNFVNRRLEVLSREPTSAKSKPTAGRGLINFQRANYGGGAAAPQK